MSLGSEAIVSAQWRAHMHQALLTFFSDPSVLDCEGAFARGGAGHRAETLTAYLCGVTADTEVQGIPPGGSDAVAQRKVRVLLPGCFDLMHAGHYNALRQAKTCLPGRDVELVAGVISDEAIEKTKGAPTVQNHGERLELVRACRWVDDVAPNLPYAMPVSLLDELRCEYCVHGDDFPKTSDGSGYLDQVHAAGRLVIVKRTEGTSTTMLIGRLLSASKEHLLSQPAELKVQRPHPHLMSESMQKVGPPLNDGSEAFRAPLWMLLPTMSRMALFFANRPRTLAAASRVVYAPGEWDLFHPGHVRFLAEARKLGDFLVVGCYSDDTIHQKKGRNYPLQTLSERALNLLACKHVDDVLLGAPWQVSQDVLTTLNVAVVATGTTNPYSAGAVGDGESFGGLGDPFAVPRAAGLLAVIVSESPLTMDIIAERILRSAASYVTRQKVKTDQEEDYHTSKVFVPEV